MRIKVDDMVQVRIGVDRGAQGRVLKIDHKAGKAIVEGLNKVWKHVKRSQKNPQGGRLQKEMPLQLSNITVVCEACGKASRMGSRLLEGGGKERYCKKCNAATGLISPARTKAAT
jgi:large subunit ribosomal protein L24